MVQRHILCRLSCRCYKLWYWKGTIKHKIVSCLCSFTGCHKGCNLFCQHRDSSQVFDLIVMQLLLFQHVSWFSSKDNCARHVLFGGYVAFIKFTCILLVGAFTSYDNLKNCQDYHVKVRNMQLYHHQLLLCIYLDCMPHKSPLKWGNFVRFSDYMPTKFQENMYLVTSAII